MISFYTKIPVTKAAKRPPRVLSSKVQRMEALAKRMGNAVRLDFVNGIETFKKKVSRQDLADAWARGDYDKLVTYIPFDDLPDDLQGMRNGIGNAAVKSARMEIESLPPNVNENLRFDVFNPRIKRYLDRRTGEFITNVKQDVVTVVQNAVVRSFTEARTPREIADEIRGSIGLLPAHQVALERYKAGLVAEKTAPAQIEKLGAAYENRLLDYRAKMIGRTEAKFAQTQGQLAVWDEGLNQGYIDRARAGKRWITEPDACEKCVAIADAGPVLLTESFDTEDGPLGGPPLHPHCFLEGEKVLTARGEIPIEKVTVGDEVLTHRGRWRKVIKTHANSYSGPLAVLTVKGQVIKSTAEHPHLVNGKWLEASKAREGDYVIQIDAAKVALEKIDDKPPLRRKIGEFFGVLFRFFINGVPVTTVNLNSDIGSVDDKIDVEFKHRVKLCDRNTRVAKFIEKAFFEPRLLAARLGSSRAFHELGERAAGTAQSLICRLRDFLAALKGSAVVPQALLLTHATGGKALLSKSGVNNGSANFELLRKAIYRPSGVEKPGHLRDINFSSWRHKAAQISAIESVSKEFFTGMVFNLTVEEDHTFICGGIVTHNCFCIVELVQDMDEE